MKDILHFVHGNGFPAQCYQQLLRPLSDFYDCCFIDRVGHTTAFPVTDNWGYLVQEVIMSITMQAEQPVIGVGHSLGGVLTVLAAIQEPQLFKAVIILDSPMITRFQSMIIRWSKQLGLIDRLTPAHRTQGRREHWKTREDAYHYLKRRTLFKAFTQECLYDYIDYGMQKNKDGYLLRFDPRIEYSIFRTMPHTLSQTEGQLHVPTTLIYGDESNIIHRSERRYMEKHYGIHALEIHGTHMFPFECPAQTVALMRHVLQTKNIF